MRIFIDTNILVSAAAWPGSIVSIAFNKTLLPSNVVMTCEYNIHEIIDVFHRKFRSRLSVMYDFLSSAMTHLWLVPMPEEKILRNVSSETLKTVLFSGLQLMREQIYY